MAWVLMLDHPGDHRLVLLWLSRAPRVLRGEHWWPPRSSRPASGSADARIDPRSHVATYVALIGLAATFLAPLVWMISTSLKTGPQAVATPPVWLPQPIVWGNYPEALSRIDFPIALRNSLIYAVPSVVGTVLSCSLVAYGFARIRWPGRDIVFLILLATMMLPTQVTFIPLYVTFSKLGWIGTYLPLLIPTFLGQSVLHLPAAPVLPVDPGRAVGRGPDRRRERAADPLARSSSRCRGRP